MNKIILVGNYDAKKKVVTAKRLSNNFDVIPVVFPDLLKEPEGDCKIAVEGSIINQKGNVYVEAYSLDTNTNSNDSTICELKGTIKKLYPVRTTKKGHKLQDFLVEAEGQLIKVVAFEPCPDYITVGINVRVRGRLQSRAFTQLATFGTLSKVVYEVALKNLEVIEEFEVEDEDLFDAFDLLEDENESGDN